MRIWSDDSGQGLTEYSLILGLIALIVIIVIGLFGEEVTRLYQEFVESWPAWTTSK